MTSQLAKCDAGCNKVFMLYGFKTDKLNNGVEKTYFNCPHCNHEYVAFYKDDEIKALQAEMDELRMKQKCNPKQKRVQQMQKLQKKINGKMKLLKEKMQQQVAFYFD